MGDVIVTVHGTNAGRPEDDGDRWWQKGSAFQKRLSELVTSADGSSLEFRPFHWSGRNSETDRREAGRQLARKLREIEKEGRPYHVIGHSHGGSVAYLALIATYVALAGGFLQTMPRLTSRLFRAQSKTSSYPLLPGLKSWTTVGAPYIVTQRSWNILALFDVWGQCVLLAIGAYSIALIATSLIAYIKDIVDVLIPLLFVATLTLILWQTTRYARSISSRVVRSRIEQNFGARASLLRHGEDEAISGLASSLRIAPKLFASSQIRRLATGPLLLTAILLAGVDLVFTWGAGGWEDKAPFLTDLHSYMQKFSYPAMIAVGYPENCTSLDCGGHFSWWEYPIYAIYVIDEAFSSLGHYVVDLVHPTPVPNYGDPFFHNKVGRAIWATFKFCFPAGVLIIFALAARIVLPLFTRPLAWFLNVVTGRNLKNAAYGNDAPGERVARLTAVPPSFEDSWKPLPASVADAIESYTEQFALETLRRTRKLLGATSLACGPLDVSELVGGSLSWRELIHTSYFDVDEFIRLLAVGLIEAGGLKASEAFRVSSDFEEARGWLHAIRIPQVGEDASDGRCQ